jgi:acetylornithine/N-succinyldiaminopimelate aminotransferase
MSSLLGVYDRDLVVVSGRGSYLFDHEGRKYLDFAAGVGVNGLGYGDRKVVAAIRKQAGQLIHASNLYHTELGAALADRLVALAFPSKVFFCNSGTEAMEAALKFARRIGRPKGRTALVAFEGSFHGRTMGSLSLTWTAKYREPFEPLIPGARFCAWNDLEAARRAVGEDTAAVVIEPVQGEGGVRPAPEVFLKGLSELCRERGVLLVADEIQCGLGRTGQLFAHRHSGIVPDILTLAKPLGGGLPLGAVLLREDLASEIKPGDHGSTFGGNPVALAASLAVIDRIESPGFLEKVARKGETLRRGLRRIAKRMPGSIADVRGLGLMVGAELTFPPAGVLKALRARGVLATRAGENVVRVLPPLTVSGKEIRVFLEAFEASLAEALASEREAAQKGDDR